MYTPSHKHHLTRTRHLAFTIFIIASVLLPLLSLPLQQAQADAGGWTTETPTPTITVTPIILIIDTYPKPVSSITPAPNVSTFVIIPEELEAMVTEVTPEATSESPISSSYLACFPLALVALIIGVLVLNRLRSGLRGGQ